MNEEKTTPSSPDGQYLSKLPADNPAADSDPATDSDSDTSPPAAPLPPALPWILSVKVVGPPTDLLPPSSSSPVPSLSPRTNDGTTTFDIDVDPEAEISVLRRAIEARTGLSPERQRLIFRGRLLPQHAAGSTERVRDVCGLGNGMVIHLVPRPAGSCEATAETAVTTTAGAVRVEGSTSGSSETSGVTDSTGELILSIDDILGALSIPDMLASANPGGGTTFQAANIPGGASGIVVMGGMGGMGDGAVAFREIANSIPQAAGGDAPTVPPHPSGAAEENVPGNTAASRGRRLLRILRGGGRSSPRPSPEIANGGPRPSPVPAPPTAGGLSGRLFSASNALRRMSGTGSSEAIVTEGEMAGAPSPMPGLVFPTVTGTGGRPTPPSLDALRSAFAVAAHQAEGGMAAAAGAALARVEVPEDLGSPSLGLPARRHSIGGGERRESRGPQPYVPEGAHSLEHIRQGLMSIHTILGEVEGRRLQEEEGEGVEVVLAEESGEESASANTNTTTGIPTPTRSRQFDVPRRRYYRGQWIDCRDTVNQWLEATVVDVISPELLVNPPANASPPPYASRSVRQLSTSESFRLDARDPTVAAGDLAGRTRLLYRPATDAAGIAERLEAGEELQSEEVLATADDVDLLLVHYNGWPSRWDEWIRSDSDRVRPFRSRTRHQRNGHALPTPQSSYHLAPPTHLSQQTEDSCPSSAAHLLPELLHTVQTVISMAESVAPIEATDRPGPGLPWSAAGATAVVPSADLLRPLAPILDRLGRVLQDFAPRVDAWAEAVASERGTDNPDAEEAAPADPPDIFEEGPVPTPLPSQEEAGRREDLAEAADFINSSVLVSREREGPGGVALPGGRDEGPEGFPSLANWLTSNIVNRGAGGTGSGGGSPPVPPGMAPMGRIVRSNGSGGIDVHIHAIVTPTSGFVRRTLPGGLGEGVTISGMDQSTNGPTAQLTSSTTTPVTSTGRTTIRSSSGELFDSNDLSLFDDLYSERPLANPNQEINNVEHDPSNETAACGDSSNVETTTEDCEDQENDDNNSSSCSLPELIPRYDSDSGSDEDEEKETGSSTEQNKEQDEKLPPTLNASPQTSNLDLNEFYDVQEHDPDASEGHECMVDGKRDLQEEEDKRDSLPGADGDGGDVL